MANLGGALQVLGQGLFQVADRRAQREAVDLEAMRREALAKMQMDHDTALADKKIAADKELFDKNTEARTAEQARDMAFRAGERAASDEAATKRMGMQLSAAQESERRRAREDVRGNYTRLITSVDSQIKGLQTEYAKALSAAGGKLDADSEKYFSGLAASLQQQRDDLARSQVYELQRVDSGGYGKGLTEDEVRGMMPAGAKGPRQDASLFPTQEGPSSMTQQAIGMKPADSLAPSSGQPQQFGSQQQPFPSGPSDKGFQVDPTVAGAAQGPQDLFPAQPVAMTPAAPFAPAAPPPMPMPGENAGPTIDPTTSSVMNSAQPPPVIPPAVMPDMPANATPIQRHAAMSFAQAMRALQLVRSGQPVDRESVLAAKRVGWSKLKESGWTTKDLQAIGL